MKLAKRMNRLGTETAFEVLAKAQKLEAQGKNVIHLEIGEPDFNTPENIISAGQNALSNGFTSYNPSPGYGDLRDVIANEINTSRGINVSGENVIVTPGGKPIMFFVMLALIESGDEVLYPNPGFPIYESMIEFCGGTAVPMKLHGDRDFNIDIEEVRSQITSKTKLMIINSPNNPCGSILGDSELEQLANIAKENNILVLSDEIYSRFLFEGEHNSITTFPDMLSRTIILDGFSKTYAMTGWRIGYAAGDKEIIKAIAKIQSQSTTNPSSISQAAAVEALNGKQDFIQIRSKAFQERRDFVVNSLNAIEGIECIKPDGAFYVFPSCKGMMGKKDKNGNKINNDFDFVQSLLENNGVAVVQGSAFGLEGFFRISYATSMDKLKDAMGRIKNFCESLS